MHTRQKEHRVASLRDLRIFTHPRAPSYPKRRSVARTIGLARHHYACLYLYIEKGLHARDTLKRPDRFLTISRWTGPPNSYA